MKRSWTLWLIFTCCVVVVIAVLAWVSLIVIRLDEAGAKSRQNALLEENTRLALWRMESMLAPFIAQENARPYYSYRAFFPAERAYTRMLARLEPNEILIPSPLLTSGSTQVKLYFQWGPAGDLSSPQIPASSLQGRVIEGYSNGGQIEESTRLLNQFAGIIPRQELLHVAPTEWLPMERPNGIDTDLASASSTRQISASAPVMESNARISSGKKEEKQKGAFLESEDKLFSKAAPPPSLAQEVIKNSPAEVAKQVVSVPQQQEQMMRNDMEYQARLNTNLSQGAEMTKMQKILPKDEESSFKAPQAAAFENKAAGILERQALTQNNNKEIRDEKNVPVMRRRGSLQRSIVSPPAEIKISLLKPVWINDELILIRRVSVDKDEYIQGCWLDWPRIQDWLIASIRDLFPQAHLEAGKDGNNQGRSLAALPVLMDTGPFAANLANPVSPLRFSLWIAWLCVGTAILATAILFWGTHSLSERRAAFVSAVTHELRTPLTTFRLYTEMLAEGMVPEEKQRHQYLVTLKQEADRQYHLIENVLAYSRMERGRYGGQKETISLGAWLERIQPRLVELADLSAMTFVPADENMLADLHLLTDVAALERILFNLVDNACKYARSAADKRIHIEAALENKKIRIRIRDHGPGIPTKDVAKLFKPFHKSARDAANSSPGVGLGLSLCRRLARSIGGDLILEQNQNNGATFALVLPLLQGNEKSYSSL
jgi:signal transduction histidine kinase